ncbi:MAG TPA: zf-HC2 domain-containing protein [Gemmataceae bacterium]
MDCRTARLLLDLARPDGNELDGDEAQALESHLAVCPECSGLARSERQFHQQMGRAMCQVEAPPGLRDSILRRVNKERGDYYRRQLGRTLRVAVGVAACLIVAFLIWNMQSGKLPHLNVAALRDDIYEQQLFDPTPEKINEFLADHQVAAPPKFNYKYLVDYGMKECQGKQVPFLLFVRPELNPLQREGNLSARVYIVSDKQFDPQSLQTEARTGTGGYSTEVWRPNGANYAYVIIYTGESLEPFLVNDTQPAT